MEPDLSPWSYLWESGDYVQLVLPRYTGDITNNDVLDNCVMYNGKYHETFGVHDDQLYIALKKCMKERGVPIVRQRPPGENLAQRVWRERMEGKLNSVQVNRVLRELELMYQAKKEPEEMEKRLKELLAMEKGEAGIGSGVAL